ncbi:SLATT domain-containing protein [Saccharopolyspora sp. ASAGF58]|uniref:SLATT domain-containing protein n=1 Tax=Saccharopolyspora sp. ASAGF58 TaxID=2719023 RepID=UPI001440086C|nr:SLATT domain-containing protein [Saccharopolyspora sp. ASAGF58]QIZ35562.1 SLATT domain-containing protein [Saccharopolyspora sp. ASAGF58]
MERVDAAGIVGGGVLAGDRQPPDWERRIAERSEQHYRARLVQRLLVAWAVPGNLLLIGSAAMALSLWVSAIPAGVVFALAVASMALSGRFVYQQHFKVRAVESELRALECAYRENMLDELGSGDLLGLHKRYRAQLPDLVERYRGEARRDRSKDNVLQAVVIGGSIIAATVTAVSVSVVDVRGVAVALCLVVAVAAAFAGHAKYRYRAVACQQAADALDREYESVELRVGRYRRFDSEHEAYAEFADAVESLRAEQVRRLPSTAADGIGQ